MQYHIINYSSHTIHDILMTYLFYNWKFEHFESFHPFFPTPAPTFGNHWSVVFSLNWAFSFLDSSYK